jgi:predicted PurR-regulated permease PerM
MIPVFGPFIGAIPCLIILLIINPWQSLEFLIFIIILQQVDGNIIGPHILGDSMGLPTLWVMFAIIVGGALFGVVGMFLGVPIFSVIYTLVANALNRRMMENQIDLNTK